MSQNKNSIDIPALEKRLTTALKSDVYELAKTFCEQETTQFEAFAKLFNEKETSTIFLGRLSIADLVEFSECLLLYSSSFMFSNTGNQPCPPYVLKQENPYKVSEAILAKQKVNRTLHEQIFGIYLTYCLYFLQPQQYVLPIRVSVAQMDTLHTFLTEVLLPDEQFEPVFCLFRLVNSNAFTLTPFETEFNPLLHRRFDTSEVEASFLDEKEVEVDEDFLLFKELQEDTMLKRINNIHKAYVNLKEKCGLTDTKSGIDCKTINLSDYIQGLMQKTRKIFEEEKKKNLDACTSNEDTAKNRRSKIRHDAYSTPFQQQRHRRHRQKHDEKIEIKEKSLEAESLIRPSKAINTLKKNSLAKKNLSSIEVEVRKEFEARERKASERCKLKRNTHVDQPSTSTQSLSETEADVKRIIKQDPASEMDEDEELIKQRFDRIKAQL